MKKEPLSSIELENKILRDEVERLTKCLFEQRWLNNVNIHKPGCEFWGPNHYDCLLQAYKRLKEGHGTES